MNEGGLFDTAAQIYPLLNAKPNYSDLTWKVPGGMTVGFSHLEHEKNVLDWQGAQIPLICFDELTHFTEKMFFYMLSRNRSTCGVRPYVRATTNPEKNSWVRKFIDWWIDPKTGFPIKERAGVIRWFTRENGETIWSDHQVNNFYKSFTFIPSKLSDNKILMEADPGYEANLNALAKADREKLRDGNWNAEEKPGEFFQKHWFEVVPTAPVCVRTIRYWDRASGETEDSDWSVGVKLGQTKQGSVYVLHMVRVRASPHKLEQIVLNTAKQDGTGCTVYLEQDPGQAGVADVQNYIRLLKGFYVKTNKVSVDKVTRAKPVSAQAEAGNIAVVEGKWNDEFFNELESFPPTSTGHDDIVDAFSGAYNMFIDKGFSLDSMSKL